MFAFQQLDRLTARTSASSANSGRSSRPPFDRCPTLEYVVPQAGMIVFPRFRDGRSSDALVDRLRRDHDTLVVPGRLFEAPAHVRIAFGGARDVVERGAAALVAACASD